MFDYLRGKLVYAVAGKAVLEVGGVGIVLDMPPAEDNLSAMIGEEVTVFTRLMIKEEMVFMYAFRKAEERKLFNLILGVSGFGPRLALSLLGIFTVSQFYVAVLEENIKELCRAHGVGRKAAQRLILELKEKLPTVIPAPELASSSVSPAEKTIMADITEALCALGYSPGEASAAVGKALETHRDGSREELLKLALKSMARQ